ncbi:MULTISPECIES: ABC transporter permease [Amycolatopsis]|uniref:Oligopeptide transport system permease protein OppC n=1 Tax=Amycolatopsis viridis TaxID=185678 RepID=A0ABX0STH3_9PSEU|nr:MULTISPECIES: ABC transporter permease [Amycolatopsis]NIH78680.1 peptide/nickel transport system permease protein [Amycolatopsis viridis]NIH87298.1 peptide/nickel transport system permease protein [Amycolatopsis granulosa]
MPERSTTETAATAQLADNAPKPQVEREFTVRERGQFQLVLRRFLQHRLAVASLVLLLLIVLLAYVGGWLWKYGPDDITPDNSQPPSGAHPFGTDAVGKDMLANVLRGTQISLQISVLVAIFSTVVGTIWGAVAGYYRGWIDTVLMRISDLVLTLPLLAVAAVLAHNVGGSWWLIAVVIAGLYWAYVSRVARGVVLSLREKEFVEAARALGAGDARIIFRHLVPNALGSVIVNATILVSIGILLETALSFLGFGVRPPDTSLGLLVSAAQTAVDTRPWLFYFPGLFIILIALTINFIGDGLRDAFDPQQTKVRA